MWNLNRPCEVLLQPMRWTVKLRLSEKSLLKLLFSPGICACRENCLMSKTVSCFEYHVPHLLQMSDRCLNFPNNRSKHRFVSYTAFKYSSPVFADITGFISIFGNLSYLSFAERALSEEERWPFRSTPVTQQPQQPVWKELWQTIRCQTHG